jgi:hypothetical protein
MELAQIPPPAPASPARGANRPNGGGKKNENSLFAKIQKLCFAKIWKTRKLGNFGLQKVSKTSKLWNSGLHKLRTNSEQTPKLWCEKSPETPNKLRNSDVKNVLKLRNTDVKKVLKLRSSGIFYTKSREPQTLLFFAELRIHHYSSCCFFIMCTIVTQN